MPHELKGQGIAAFVTLRSGNKPTDDLNTRRILLIDPIEWRGGWPRIENNGPSNERKRAPRVR